MTREEAIKTLMSATVWTDDEREALGILIPDFRESEDERIRYDIMEAVENWFPYERVEEIRAYVYLEKQKDASKAIEAVDRIDKYIDEHLANAHDMKDSNSEKEYYLGWDAALGKMAGILQDVYSGEKQKEQDECPEYCVRSHCMGCSIYEKQKEQKPIVIQVENPNIQKLDPNVVVETRTDGTNPNVVNESLTYQPVEWSEEDELMRTAVIQTLETLGGRGTTGMQIAWLKSLRPQPHWKPTEEQMDALLKASDLLVSDLNSLYNDLKQLMEEDK